MVQAAETKEVHTVEADAETGGEGSAVDDTTPEILPAATTDSRGGTKKRAARKGTRRAGEGKAHPLAGSGGASSPRTKSRHATPAAATAAFIKYAALFLLVAQMVGLVLLMRYSRTVQNEGEPLYLASTAVFWMEIQKLILCLIVIAYQSDGALLQELRIHVWGAPMEIAKLSVPSLLYTVQNNLLYLALTNLDAATYQVCYQLKILTTALFSAVMLGRKFSAAKWASLVILTLGVAIVQISGSGDHHSAHHEDAVAGNHAAAEAEAERLLQLEAAQHQHRVVGLIAVLCAACTSGFSGVYFEKILKGSRTSLWIRNVQMGLPSVLIAFTTIYIKDAAAVRERGFFSGYSPLVWTVVSVQAFGGLIVATVVKYADNVLKVFATSFSIVVSCIISAFLFDFHPTYTFLLGASLVVTATVMYSSPETGGRLASSLRRGAAKPLLPTTNR